MRDGKQGYCTPQRDHAHEEKLVPWRQGHGYLLFHIICRQRPGGMGLKMSYELSRTHQTGKGGGGQRHFGKSDFVSRARVATCHCVFEVPTPVVDLLCALEPWLRR